MGSGRCSEREHVGRKPMKANPALNVFACGQPGWLQVARLAAGASGDDEAPSAGSLDSSCGQLSLGSGLAQWNVDRQRSALFARLRHCSEGRRLFG